MTKLPKFPEKGERKGKWGEITDSPQSAIIQYEIWRRKMLEQLQQRVDSFEKRYVDALRADSTVITTEELILKAGTGLLEEVMEALKE